MQMLGVDIGGSGIKGCLVDTETGELIGERHRIATPQPATPAAVAHTLKALVEHFQWKGPVGCGFPATIHNGISDSPVNAIRPVNAQSASSRLPAAASAMA